MKRGPWPVVDGDLVMVVRGGHSLAYGAREFRISDERSKLVSVVQIAYGVPEDVAGEKLSAALHNHAANVRQWA